MSTTITLSSKGQLVLPSSIRRGRQWTAGTELVAQETAEGILLKAAKPFPETRVEQAFGMAQYTGKAKTVAAMNAAVRAEARRRK